MGVTIGLKTCFGCCQLRTGCFIVFGIEMIVFMLNILTALAYVMAAPTSSPISFPGMILVISPIITLFGIIPNALGLYALLERKPSFIMPFVYLHYLVVGLILVTITLFLAYDIFMAYTGHLDRYSAGKFAFTFQLGIFLIVMLWYIISVIHSYYKTMKQELAISKEKLKITQYL